MLRSRELRYVRATAMCARVPTEHAGPHWAFRLWSSGGEFDAHVSVGPGDPRAA